LEPGTSTTTTKFLGLAAPRISDKQGTVIPDENVLDLLLGLLIDVLLVVSDERLGDALPDGVDLRGMTSTLDANPHVDAIEAVATQKENGLEHLVAQDLRLHQLDWGSVDLDQTLPTLAVGHCHGRLLPPEALH